MSEKSCGCQVVCGVFSFLFLIVFKRKMQKFFVSGVTSDFFHVISWLKVSHSIFIGVFVAPFDSLADLKRVLQENMVYICLTSILVCDPFQCFKPKQNMERSFIEAISLNEPGPW